MPRPKTAQGREDDVALALYDARQMLEAMVETEHARREERGRQLRFLAAQIHAADEGLRDARRLRGLDAAAAPKAVAA